MRECTQNLGWTPARAYGVALAVLRRVQRATATWAPRLVALVIALELGLLSPLSCVIHCFVQQLLAERPAIAFFLCGEHSQTPATVLSAHPDAPNTPANPASTLTPRALYELVSLATPLVTLVSLLVAVLIALPARRLAPLTLPPPTPPPRLSPA